MGCIPLESKWLFQFLKPVCKKSVGVWPFEAAREASTALASGKDTFVLLSAGYTENLLCTVCYQQCLPTYEVPIVPITTVSYLDKSPVCCLLQGVIEALSFIKSSDISLIMDQRSKRTLRGSISQFVGESQEDDNAIGDVLADKGQFSENLVSNHVSNNAYSDCLQ